MTEVWKDIEDYEGYYQVSDLGRVKSLDRVIEYKNGTKRLLKGKQLIGTERGGGYLAVALCKDGTQKTAHIHKLVAKAFIPNPENKPTVDHINRNRTDNRVENLRWATYPEQVDNTDRKKPVVGIKGKTVLYFESAKQTEEYGFTSSNICDCCRGKRKTHRGYVWKYVLPI